MQGEVKYKWKTLEHRFRTSVDYGALNYITSDGLASMVSSIGKGWAG